SRPEHTSLPYAPVGPAPLSSLFPYTTLFRSVEIGKLPEDGDDAAQPSTGSRDNSAGAPLGLSVETLAPETARSVGVEGGVVVARSEEHTSELQSRENLVCGLQHDKDNMCVAF